MWTEIFRAWTRPSKTCPRCGDSRVRLSRQPYGALARLLGIRAFRCEACRERYASGRWRLRRPLSYTPPPEYWPPEVNDPPAGGEPGPTPGGAAAKSHAHRAGERKA